MKKSCDFSYTILYQYYFILTLYNCYNTYTILFKINLEEDYNL